MSVPLISMDIEAKGDVKEYRFILSDPRYLLEIPTVGRARKKALISRTKFY